MITKNNKLRSSLLDLNGDFSLLNSLRCLKPGQKHTLVLAFTPSQGRRVREIISVNNSSKPVNMEVNLACWFLVLWNAGCVHSNYDLRGDSAGRGCRACCHLFSSWWDPWLRLCAGEGEPVTGLEGQATCLSTTVTSKPFSWSLMCTR